MTPSQYDLDNDQFLQMPSMRVDDKVALVTGAAAGIGQALAIGLAHYGARVAVADLPEKIMDAQRTVSIITQEGGYATTVAVDVSSVDSIKRMNEEVLATMGRIDILVNNAGINMPTPALEVTEEQWDAILDVNLKGTFFCAQAVAPGMIERQYGKIINISSQNGVIAYFDRAAYCASKGGVNNLTRELALEWGNHGINVNAIAPTYVKTSHTESTLSDPAKAEDIIQRIPMGRIAKLEDLIGAAVYLASPASDMVTGHTLLIDGGWTTI